MTTVDSQTPPRVRSPEQSQRVIDAVHRHFTIAREYYREDLDIDFFIDPSQAETKQAFLALSSDLRATGDMAILRRTDEGLYLKVFPRPPVQKSKTRTPLILLAATIAIIFIDGLIRPSIFSFGGPSPAWPQLIVISLIYTVALIAIIGIHETGHKIASWLHGMNSSWPYFIPGIPGIWPTMGAVINAREPPPNKDSLFDLGISGPIAGLIATVIVSIVAVASAQTAPISPNQSYSPIDMYTSTLVDLFVRSPYPNYAVTGTLFSLLYFAYTFGFLITFVNLLPAWQLDGGHIANASVSPRTHHYLTYISAVVMVLAGFWLMGLLVLLLSNRYPSLTPLDNVSPLSRKRKVIFGLVWILSAAIFVLVIYNNAFFWQGSIMQGLLGYIRL